ncbi:MAG: RuBisCO large subunit C-terminal-like domain-containing protein [Spirochaetia bacterium]
MGAAKSREGEALPALSGARFRVRYLLSGDEPDARRKAEDICLEQTVEFPADLVPAGVVRDEIVGRLEAFGQVGPARYFADISFAVETAADDLVQLLNVVFGNISIKPGIRVEALTLPQEITTRFRGPRFGVGGLRQTLGIALRPLISTALKPMGLSPTALADQAYQFAAGGIDIVKDDHGLTDQSFCPFSERVARCAEAVARANTETGLKSIYVPNVTGPAGLLERRAEEARSAGAGGLLLCPGLMGIDALRFLAEHEDIRLPVLAHPSFTGSFVTAAESGISHAVLYGQLMRLAGADATVFPNYGGRFSFSREQCAGIAALCAEEMGGLRPILPAPGGGMTADRAGDMREVYGRDFILLIGAGLHRLGGDLRRNAAQFVELVGRM